MNKKCLTIFMAVLYSVSSSISYSQSYKTCATNEAHEENLKKDPSLEKKMTGIESHTKLYEMAGGANAKMMSVTIPVVVHVIYNTAAQNISDTQILSQIDVLNEDFRKLNADASLIPAVWQNVAADAQIEFCLAKRDPQGNSTTGITRTYTANTSFSTNNAMKYTSQGGKDIWDRNQYLNIWVCNMSGNIAGYAQFPGGSAASDGVVVHYNTFGRTGNLMNGYNKGRVTTHEVGHWLNLRHIWGDTQCGNDYVTDTPVQQGANYGCPSYPYVTCSNGPSGDMFMNYMDYTLDACKYMFTNGQSTRMNAVLAPGGFRFSLTSSLGCVPPGSGSTCNIPAGLNASVSSTSAILMWNSTGAVSYNVRIKEISSPTWTSSNTSMTSSNVSGLIPGTTYEFQVQSVCFSTTSSYSNSFTFTTPGVLCNVPTGLNVSNINSSFVTVSWSNSGANTYIVRYKPTSGTTWTNTSTIQTTVSIGGLTVGITYEVQVQGICNTSSSAFSNSVNFIIPLICNPVSGLVAYNISTNSATLSWTNSGANSYNVRYKANSSTSWNNLNTSQTSVTINGLTSGTAYEFQVQGVCSGLTSAYSESATFTTLTPPCNIPTGLTATNITTYSATLSWAGTGANSYYLRYKPTSSQSWSTLLTTQTSVSINGLIAGTTYEFQVQSVCSLSSSAYSPSVIFTTSVPSCNTPSGLSASGIAYTSATLSWGNTGANSYNIRYKSTSSSLWINTNTSQTTINISNLSPGTEYEFQVQSVCTVNSSSFSTSAIFNTPASCDAPTNFSTTNITSSSAFLSWSGTGAIYYNVRYKTTSGTTWNNLSTTQTSITVNGLNSGTAYEFQVQSVCSGILSLFSESATFTTIVPACSIPSGLTTSNITTSTATLSWSNTGASSYYVRYRPVSGYAWNNLITSQTFVNLGGLIQGISYEFQVQSYCGSVYSGYSASLQFITLSPACSIPSGLNAGNITVSTATLSWNSTGANSYNVRYKPVSLFTWNNLSSGQTSVSLAGLNSGTAYEFQVQSVCGATFSAFSSSSTFTTLVIPTCATPSGLTVTNITNSSATLSWNGTGGVTYSVRYKPTSASTWSMLNTMQTTITIAGLSGGTPYEFQVQSNCGTMSSSFSESASFTTMVPSCAVPGGLTVSNITGTTANISWNSTGAGSYYVKYKIANSYSWAYFQTFLTSVNIGGLLPGTTYEFQVQSMCGSTTSGYSASGNFTTIGTGCAIPSGLNAINITASSVTISWNSTGANSYNVRYKSTAANTWSNLITTQTFINIAGLNANTNYEFQVQGVCGNSISAYSNQFIFTTIGNPSNVVTVGNGTATTELPYGTAFLDQKVQFFISKGELDAAGFNVNNNRLTSLAFYVTGASNQTMNNFTIKIAHITTSAFSNNYFINTYGSTIVYSGSLTASANNWNVHNFDVPFIYNGVNNLLIEICFDNNSASFNSLVRYSATQQLTVLHSEQNVLNTGICNANEGIMSYNRPNVQFTFSGSESRFTDETIIEVEDESSLLIYPNPATSETTINFNLNADDDDCLIELYSITGALFYSKKIKGKEGENTVEINFNSDLGSIVPGLYFIKVVTRKKEFLSKLVIN